MRGTMICWETIPGTKVERRLCGGDLYMEGTICLCVERTI